MTIHVRKHTLKYIRVFTRFLHGGSNYQLKLKDKNRKAYGQAKEFLTEQ